MQLFSNFAQSTLSSTLLIAGVTLEVSPTEGGLFTAPEEPNYELLVLTDGVNWEVVKSTARVGDTITVVREYEGVAREWPSGTVVRAVATKATLNNFIQRGEITGLAAVFAYRNFY